jgi:hypothetical protein
MSLESKSRGSGTGSRRCSDDADTGASSGGELSAEQVAELGTESEFAECIRDHGIEGFPDPQVNEYGFKVVGTPWERELEAWNEAQQACQSDLDEAAAPRETVAGWEKVVPGGDCHCADGSEFAFWERRADPTRVVFFLDGGGACYDATTCAFLPEDPGVRLEHPGRRPIAGQRDLRLGQGRQPVPRLQLRHRAVLHR